MQSLIGIYRESGWAFRLYYFYLVLVVLYALVRFILLSRELWFRPVRPPEGANESETARHLARAALKGIFPIEFPPLATQIDARFEFLAARLVSRLRSLRRIAICTAMASGIAFFLGLDSTFQLFDGSLGIYAIAGGLRLTAEASFFGMAIAFWVYLIASLFEAKLARRRAEWDYLRHAK